MTQRSISDPPGTEGAVRHRLGIIGLGMAAAPHARSLHALSDRLSVVAAFSPTERRRQRFTAEYGFPTVGSVDEILDDPTIGSVLLLTPPNARTELVSALAERGKHILIEKPLERTTEAATAIVERCEAAGVALGVVFQHRFRDAAVTLRTLLADGALGAIGAVELAVPWWRPQAYYDAPGRGSYERDGGGVLINQAIHGLDLMLSLAGPVVEVTAMAGTTILHSMESEDLVSAGLRFESGALGTVTASTAAFPGRDEHLILVGDRATATLAAGTLTIDHRDGRTDQSGAAAGTGGGADPMDFPHDAHQRVIEDFFDGLDQGRPPGVPGRAALEVHQLIDAITTSAADGCRVRIDHT